MLPSHFGCGLVEIETKAIDKLILDCHFEACLSLFGVTE
jgi:hypothetical protein